MENWGLWRSLIPVLAGAVGTLFLIWLANRTKDDATVCKTGLIVLVIYLLGAVMGLVGIYHVLAQNQPGDGLNDEAWLPAALIMMAIVFSLAFLDSLRRKITWNNRGIIVQRLFRKTRKIDWIDISDLRYKPLVQYWRIGFDDGSGAAFSEVMSGSKALLNAFEKQGIIEK